jgi:hypothetical protein
LESIHLHASVEAFAGKPFYGCQNLASITVDSANTKLDSRNNCNAVIETATNKLLLGCKSTLFPNTLTGIGSYALAGCKDITTVNLPNTITKIDESAFEECANLVSVTLPINGFNFLGAKAFKNCKNLTNIQLPSSLNSLGESAFEGCEQLESINVPANITTLATAVFKNCKKLQTLAVPENITKIDSDALGWCSGLTSISISANVTEIASDAIRYCPALETLTVSASNTKYDSRNNCNAIIETATNALVVGCKNTVIPSTVTSIKSGAFYGCTSLTDIVIPNTVTSISGSAFSGCTNLNYTTYNSSKYLGNAANAYMFLADCMSGETSPVIHSDTKTIGDNAFSGLSRLNSVNIPASVVEIGSSAFSSSSLGNIAMPNSVVTIGTGVFSSCNSLLDIIFSDALTTIPQNTCRGCGRLINVKLPASLTTIEKDAFSYCYDLKTIDIPANVTKICDGAFASTGLKTVILRNSSKVCELEMDKTENSAGTKPFPQNTTIKFYVPDNLVAAYQSAPI